MDMYTELLDINTRPGPFEFYSAPELWTDEHTSRKMLAHHLDENTDIDHLILAVSQVAGIESRQVQSHGSTQQEIPVAHIVHPAAGV